MKHQRLNKQKLLSAMSLLSQNKKLPNFWVSAPALCNGGVVSHQLGVEFASTNWAPSEFYIEFQIALHGLKGV